MWNGIALAPQEHTPALTPAPSQLTLVGALARKPLGQSSFWGVGSLEWLNLHNYAAHLNTVSDIDSQDAGLSETGHIFELQLAVLEP